jgi:beta-galactosidase
VRFVHNWSWESHDVPAPTAAQDILSGIRYAAGQVLELGAWDVRILTEPGPP